MVKSNNNLDITERLFVASGCCSSLWPKAITIEISQRSYLRLLIATVLYDQWPQQLRCHRGTILASGHYSSLWPKTICGPWSLQFPMSKDNNNCDVTDRLFVVSGCYDSLWPKSISIEMSQRGYLRPLVTTVPYGQRLFVAASRYSSLCPKATTIEMSQRLYWQPLVATIYYGHRPLKETICSLWWLQFIMAIGH